MYAFLGRPEHEALGKDDRATLRATVLACEGHHLHHFQSDGAAAVRTFEASLELRETARALVGLADALDGTDKDRIERSFRRALELEPLDQDARAQLGVFLMTGQGCFREGRRLLLEARRGGSPMANDFYMTIPGGLNLLGVLALFR